MYLLICKSEIFIKINISNREGGKIIKTSKDALF